MLFDAEPLLCRVRAEKSFVKYFCVFLYWKSQSANCLSRRLLLNMIEMIFPLFVFFFCPQLEYGNNQYGEKIKKKKCANRPQTTNQFNWMKLLDALKSRLQSELIGQTSVFRSSPNWTTEKLNDAMRECSTFIWMSSQRCNQTKCIDWLLVIFNFPYLPMEDLPHRRHPDLVTIYQTLWPPKYKSLNFQTHETQTLRKNSSFDK